MLEIDVVNDCLASLGEAPVASLEDDHPFLPTARRLLGQELIKIQAQSWWFNQEYIELSPDSAGHVYVPADAVRCDPVEGLPYVQRGRRLYDTWKGQYEIEGPVMCTLIRAVAFGDLPPAAQQVVALATVLKFQQAYDADARKTQELRVDYQQAWAFLKVEHIRSINANLRGGASFLSTYSTIFNGAGRRPFPSVSGN